jgi:hypothetical protein
MTSTTDDDLFSPITELDLTRLLLADLHDDLFRKVARFRQLSDLSMALGSSGTMLPGGEIAYHAWTEARTSFVHGNFIATVMLCQGLAEHVLAAHLATSLPFEELPDRISFYDTLDRCVARGVIGDTDAADLRRLMALRNPLSHFRSIGDPSSLSRRVVDERLEAEEHLRRDATFAIGMAVRLLALPSFRLGD